VAEERESADTSSTADREIVSTRVYDAPRELVWKAWTEHAQVKQWWGPNGFTNTIYQMDVRPGGVWRFVMHGPDGVNHQNKIAYVEVVKRERLVYDHVTDPKHHVTVTFEDQGGKTTLTMQMVFETAAERDKTVQLFNAVEGQKQTLARLAEHLGGMQ
jgi:uncharacterized protein YndB with AHSA1/START domain